MSHVGCQHHSHVGNVEAQQEDCLPDCHLQQQRSLSGLLVLPVAEQHSGRAEPACHTAGSMQDVDVLSGHSCS